MLQVLLEQQEPLVQQVLLEPQQAQLELQQALQVQLELEQQLEQQELQVLQGLLELGLLLVLVLVLQQEQQQVLLQERLLLERLEPLVLELNIQRLRHHVDR